MCIFLSETFTFDLAGLFEGSVGISNFAIWVNVYCHYEEMLIKFYLKNTFDLLSLQVFIFYNLD